QALARFRRRRVRGLPECVDSLLMSATHSTGRRAVLDRKALVVAVAIFLMGMGEEMWKRFVPKYMAVLGAPVVAIGLYGSANDLLDGLLQYPGGWLADHLGRVRALFVIACGAIAGYLAYALASTWPLVIAALPLVMSWGSTASP